MKLLRFSAVWCQPCKSLSKVLQSNPPIIPVEEIDVDTNMELAKEYGVRAVPTLVLLAEDGTVLRKQSGVTTKQQLDKFLEGA